MNLRESNSSNIFILHSLNGDTLNYWGKNIKEIFTKKNIEVISPEFPIRADSRYDKFKNILEIYLNNKTLNNNSIVIAHSIGSAYFIRFCEEFHFKPKVFIAVAPGAIYEYPRTRNDYIVDVLKQAFLKKESLDYMKELDILKYCIYSDEDDNNKEKFTRFISDTKSKEMYLKEYNHFDGYHNINEISELVDLINDLIIGEHI